MKRLLPCLLMFVVLSCNRDHKQETISNYIRYIWKIRAAEELSLSKIEEIKIITAKDSIDMLIKAYAKSASHIPSLDTIFAHIDEDLDYNSRLLRKTNRKIDSLNQAKKAAPDNSFFSDYIKSFTELRDFTATQVEDLKYQKYILTRYRQDETAVLSHQVLCEYKVKGHSADSTTRIITQTFFLSPDEKRIYVVK